MNALWMVPVAMLTAATQTKTTSPVEPDNTGKNREEVKEGKVTAQDQSNGKSDVETTRLIRRALVSDSSLSTYGHNVKIITANGKTILKGPVKSEEEMKAIKEKAVAVAGQENVTCELTVKK